MVMTRITAPAAEPITLSEAKAHLRISDASEDTLISGLIKSAREEVEEAAGIALINQDWRLYLDAWPCSGIVRLRRSPVQYVSVVTVYDGAGAATTITPPVGNLDKISSPARFLVPDAASAPGRAINGIEIDFRCGFGATGVDVPDGLKRAMLLLISHWYEHRGAGESDGQTALWPNGFDRIMDRYRRLEL
jgi:uncharacterized phiE125 gp8 family phage protein